MDTNGVYNKEDYLNHLTELKPNGYTMNPDGVYILENLTKRIEIEFAKITYYPHSVTFRGVSVDYRFHEVEDILSQVSSSFTNLSFGTGSDHDTFSKGFGKITLGEAAFEEMIKIEVENDLTFRTVRNKLEVLTNAALTFVSQYNTLQGLYDYGQSLLVPERANFYSQPLTFRAMIIKKILNTSDYSSYSSGIVNKYTNVNPNAEKSAFSIALKTHLDNL